MNRLSNVFANCKKKNNHENLIEISQFFHDFPCMQPCIELIFTLHTFSALDVKYIPISLLPPSGVSQVNISHTYLTYAHINIKWYSIYCFPVHFVHSFPLRSLSNCHTNATIRDSASQSTSPRERLCLSYVFYSIDCLCVEWK